MSGESSESGNSTTDQEESIVFVEDETLYLVAYLVVALIVWIWYI